MNKGNVWERCMGVHTSLWDSFFISFRYILRCGIASAYSGSSSVFFCLFVWLVFVLFFFLETSVLISTVIQWCAANSHLETCTSTKPLSPTGDCLRQFFAVSFRLWPKQTRSVHGPLQGRLPGLSFVSLDA